MTPPLRFLTFPCLSYFSSWSVIFVLPLLLSTHFAHAEEVSPTTAMVRSEQWDQCLGGQGREEILSKHEATRNGNFEYGLSTWKERGARDQSIGVSSSAAFLSEEHRKRTIPAEREGLGVEIQLRRGLIKESGIQQVLYLPQNIDGLEISLHYRLSMTYPRGVLEHLQVRLFALNEEGQEELWRHDLQSNSLIDPFAEAKKRGWIHFQSDLQGFPDAFEAIRQARASGQQILLALTLKGQGARAQVDAASVLVSGTFEWPKLPGRIAFGVQRHGVSSGYALRCISPDGSSEAELMKARGELFGLVWGPKPDTLTMVSSHDPASRWRGDLYTLSKEGLSRLLNRGSQDPSKQGDQESFAVGSIAGYVINRSDVHQTVQIFAEGALESKTLTLPPHRSTRFILKNVRDFGANQKQIVTARTRLGVMTVEGGVDILPQQQTSLPNVISLQDRAPKADISTPSWDKGKQRILFSNEHGELLTLAPKHELEPSPVTAQGELLAQYPSWSPEGARFLFTINQGPREQQGIWITRRDRSAPAQLLGLSDPQEHIGAAAWLPDGSGFLYESVRCNKASRCLGELKLFYFGLKESISVATFPNEEIRNLTISPDGRYVALIQIQERKSINPRTQQELWVLQLDEPANRWRLVHRGQPDTPTWGSFKSSRPSLLISWP